MEPGGGPNTCDGGRKWGAGRGANSAPTHSGFRFSRRAPQRSGGAGPHAGVVQRPPGKVYKGGGALRPQPSIYPAKEELCLLAVRAKGEL